MVSTVPTTIPEDKTLSSNTKEQNIKALFKLIKVFTTDDDGSYGDESSYTCEDKSHTQLFYNVTNKSDLSKCTPSYRREVYRPNEKIDNLYWYSEALKSVSSSDEPATLWTIDQVKIKRSLGRVKRPRTFSINNDMLGSNSVFEYGGGNGEPKGYSGEVSTPYDSTSVQRYRWVRHKDGSRWAFIARNNPNTTLAELRKTNSDNEFDIVFLKSPPPGWGAENTHNQDSLFFDHTSQFMGRYPSVFSNPSTYRSSTTSGFLSNRESSISDTYSRMSTNNNVNGKKNVSFEKDNDRNKDSRLLSPTFSTFSTYSEGNFAEDSSSDRYWHEFVLASTVVVQDEVNSNKRRLWRKRD